MFNSPASHGRTYLLAVGAILPFWAMDWLIPGTPVWISLVVRLLWAGVYLAGALGTSRAWARRQRNFSLAGAVISPLAMGILVHLSGGYESPQLFALAVIPVMVMLVDSWEESAVRVASILTILTVAALGVVDGRPLGTLVAWSFGALFGGAFAMAALRAVRRSRESALAEARLASIGRLAAGVAHEISNPLTSVFANLEWLGHVVQTAAPGRGGEIREVMDDTRVALDQIRGVLRDLQNLSRAPEEEQTTFELNAPIEDALRITAGRLRGMQVDVNVPDDLPPVEGNRLRLVQVLVNLLVNAADALEDTARPLIELRVSYERDRLRIVVEDNGPGVPRNLRSRIFQPFVSSKRDRGLGLGLALSREYVRACGGSLRWEQPPRGGARFVIELPPGSRAEEEPTPQGMRLAS